MLGRAAKINPVSDFTIQLNHINSFDLCGALPLLDQQRFFHSVPLAVNLSTMRMKH